MNNCKTRRNIRRKGIVVEEGSDRTATSLTLRITTPKCHGNQTVRSWNDFTFQGLNTCTNLYHPQRGTKHFFHLLTERGLHLITKQLDPKGKLTSWEIHADRAWQWKASRG